MMTIMMMTKKTAAACVVVKIEVGPTLEAIISP
jgi:hypothetical protein